MKIYAITETVTINEGQTITTTNNNSKEKDMILWMFQTRRDMLLKTYGATVQRDEYNEKECWGFVRVKLEDGVIIDLLMMASTLV